MMLLAGIVAFASGCAYTQVGKANDLLDDNRVADAIPHLQKAVDDGSKAAAIELAFIYLCDCTVPENLAKAREYYHRAQTMAPQPYDQYLDYFMPQVKARLMLADDNPDNDVAATTILRGDRYKDDPPNLDILALCYATGQGVQRNTGIARILFERAISSEPMWGSHHMAVFDYAWWLAVSADADFRDGPRALSLVKGESIDKDDPWRAEKLDTVAAVYAANDQFHTAVQMEEKALSQLRHDIAQHRDVAWKLPYYENRLKAYRAGRPWHFRKDQPISGPHMIAASGDHQAA